MSPIGFPYENVLSLEIILLSVPLSLFKLGSRWEEE